MSDEHSPAGEKAANIWKAYEVGQRHYEGEMTLFGTRMSLFLVVHSALFAFVASQRGPGPLAVAQIGLPYLGFVLALVWLAVAVSSYRWIKIWRWRLVELANKWQCAIGLKDEHLLSMTVFKEQSEAKIAEGQTRLDRLVWRVRPTLLMCCVPAIFAIAWLALAVVNK